MAIIKGNAVVNATTYELYEVKIKHNYSVVFTEDAVLQIEDKNASIYIDGVQTSVRAGVEYPCLQFTMDFTPNTMGATITGDYDFTGEDDNIYEFTIVTITLNGNVTVEDIWLK